MCVQIYLFISISLDIYIYIYIYTADININIDTDLDMLTHIQCTQQAVGALLILRDPRCCVASGSETHSEISD